MKKYFISVFSYLLLKKKNKIKKSYEKMKIFKINLK